jgi:CRISPR/Cas system-associated exonuclease Cas4 (RecB family)
MTKNLIHTLMNKTKDTKLDAKKFVKMINSAYQETNTVKEFKQKKTFAPSTVGYGHGTCARYWWIAFNGAEFTENIPAANIASMKSGTAAHERIEKLVEVTGLLKEREREIKSDSPPIRGFADLVLSIDDEEIIGEIKTIKDQYFIQRKGEGSPSPSHLLQLLIYMKIEGAQEGFILYENKNDNELLSIPIQMTEKNKEYIEYVFDWMNNVYDHYKENNPPKRGYTKSTWICKNCPVSEACLEREVGEDKIPNLKVGTE